MSSLSCCKSQAVYRPRRPEKTVLFEVIKKYYNTWCKNTEKPVPKYIEKEFKNYLGCGILAKGFARAYCYDCNKDFLIAFSCKGRGICPSCSTRTMTETAANLMENVFPCVPVRQFVISFPYRIRHYLKTNTILQTVLRIVVDEIKKRLIACSTNMLNAQIGAVSFIHHFGNTHNLHPHFHIIVADGIFTKDKDSILFHKTFLTQDDILDTEECIRKRVLRYFGRQGWFDKQTVAKMLELKNSGFSLNAKVLIQSWDREGLERLIRYCARPSFASENLRKNGLWSIYRLPKPTHKGKRFIQLEPLEFIERISSFIPYSRKHRRHYHGVFAPNSPLRKKVASGAQKHSKSSSIEETTDKVEKASLSWAKLIARIYEVNPLVCECGKEIKIITFVTHPEEIRRILNKINWPYEIPKFDPPSDFDDWDFCQLIPGTKDGFWDDEIQLQFQKEQGPDPPFFKAHSDPTHDYDDWDGCQLIPGTEDGFPEDVVRDWED